MSTNAIARAWGRNLREQREARAWSLEELADRVGVSWQSVSKWERGLSRPTAENQAHLAWVFGMSVPMLFPIQPIAPPVGPEVAA